METGDLVVVRSCSSDDWGVSTFGYTINTGDSTIYVCTNNVRFPYCMPLKGNEHLIGTKKAPEVTYEEQQRRWLSETGCAVGSLVSPKHRVKSYARGWGSSWIESMDAAIGKYGLVKAIDEEHGIRITFHPSVTISPTCRFPFFCLDVLINP